TTCEDGTGDPEVCCPPPRVVHRDVSTVVRAGWRRLRCGKGRLSKVDGWSVCPSSERRGRATIRWNWQRQESLCVTRVVWTRLVRGGPTTMTSRPDRSGPDRGGPCRRRRRTPTRATRRPRTVTPLVSTVHGRRPTGLQ